MSRAGRCRVLAAAFLCHLSVIVCATENSPHVNYMLHCQGCHLPGGIGHPGIVPNLHGQIGRFLHSEPGRAYLIQVPGAAQSALNDDQLAEVVNWMLETFDPSNVGAHFKRFTGAEVGVYRAQQLLDVAATRRELLQDNDNP